MSKLRLNPYNVHDVDVDGRRMLLHVPTTALFGLDALGAELLDMFKQRPTVGSADVRQAFSDRYPAQAVAETLKEFVDYGIVEPEGDVRPHNPRVTIDEYPLSTIVLNVNTGCNLGCTYCYKEDLMAPAQGQRMDSQTARASIDLLLRQAAKRDRVSVVFFGGEPLSNMPLIRDVVEYTERRCGEEGKTPDFCLTTNATLLTDDVVDFFDQHRFGISISIDGPKAIHDKHRRTVGDKGTYDVVAKKSRALLSRYTSRPVGARVTLTAGVTDVEAIHEHLKYDMGFFEVGFAPVTSGAFESFNLRDDELQRVYESLKRLGRCYMKAAMDGENIGFSNMHQLMTDLHDGTKKSLPCGAGIGLLAVDKDGDLNLCHRFTGSDLETFGNVESGIDAPRLAEFLKRAAERAGTDCETCRIRNLCSGGCYHESYSRYDDPHHKTYHYCTLLRDWIDFGIHVYTNILQANPGFFAKHIEPRRAVA